MLDSFAGSPAPLVLAIDGSSLGNGCICLMISLLYRNRALPLKWRVYKQIKGVLPEAAHLQLLRETAALLPVGKEVILLGDGEFDGTDWLEEIESLGWHYVCRTARDSILNEEGDRFNFKWLTPVAGEYASLPKVFFTQKGYGPLHAIYWKGLRFKKAICLISNFELAGEACFWYRKRFHIETFFSDQKSRGFNLHKSHLADPKRLERLIIAAALAYIWVIYLGCLAKNGLWQGKIHRNHRCDYSLFLLGLRLLQHLLNHNQPIPVDFKVFNYHFTLP